MPNSKSSLSEIAKEEMNRILAIYLKISEETFGFNQLNIEHFCNSDVKQIVLAGFGSPLASAVISPKEAWNEWDRRKAIQFDVEEAVTLGVYLKIREKAKNLLDEIDSKTNGFSTWDEEVLFENPHWIPLLQRIAGFFSKSSLKKQIGSLSDKHISKPGAKRMADMLIQRVMPETVRKTEVLQRLESTLEGIVRDLVGRILLENIVKNALDKKKIPYVRESDYKALKGVIYDFRADFLIPNEEDPQVFIEVRKSSRRHASLYAKDKMFSAINWKGINHDLLGIIIIDGPWTNNTIKVMNKVFDYVVPINRVGELTETIKSYINGDRSKLKWLVDFKISPSYAHAVQVNDIVKDVVIHKYPCGHIIKRGDPPEKYEHMHWLDFDNYGEALSESREWEARGYKLKHCPFCLRERR